MLLQSDPDDGVASLSYIWQVNGSQVSTGPTWTVNSVDASVGDSLTCTAIAVDFEGNSTTSTSVGSTTSNTAPVVSAVLLNNLSPYTNDVLSVSPTTFDFNGDNVTLNYEWHVLDASNGGQDTIIQVGSGSAFSSLDGSQMMGFDRDDEVYVNVTPNDGTDNGTTVESDHAVVLNTAPSAPSIALTSTSNPPIEMVDDLDCSIVGLSTDDDGDAITYTYTWYDPTGTDVQVTQGLLLFLIHFWALLQQQDCGNVSSKHRMEQMSHQQRLMLKWTLIGMVHYIYQLWSNWICLGPSQSDCDSTYSGTTLDRCCHRELQVCKLGQFLLQACIRLR